MPSKRPPPRHEKGVKRSLHFPAWQVAKLEGLRRPGKIGHNRSFSNLVVLLVERALLSLDADVATRDDR